MLIEPKKVTGPSDFDASAIWRYDEEDDLYHPEQTPEELPDSERLLSIRATFRTPFGAVFDGYIVGIERVFSIGLFGAGKVFYINMNLPDLSEQQLIDFLEAQPALGPIKVESLFPLEYVTAIRREPFVDFSGRFEIESLRGGGYRGQIFNF